MFEPAYNFGYYCNLPLANVTTDFGSGGFPTVPVTLFTWLSVMFTSFAILY